ncbi:hypothetical protein BU26DRAFT_563295 [Trematosphaeria pertusa]|uniref:Uncharacterized protein n=1 Tax=Trematosphaeria pertusa TaxID=390896 RepID=A0A6A6IL67_9PLEO|nr:uncharacterized protein BU26DRAFT_563295 [Trematosphaeria pertusa]KAF2251354.1 hypothetical protein BU26DRAFT_563295 [Trematosphaeria pertusa]
MADLPSHITFPTSRLPGTFSALSAKALPAISFTSHQVFQEVVFFFLRRTTIAFDDAKEIQFYAFLEGFPGEKGFMSVRHLEYHCSNHQYAWDCYPIGGYLPGGLGAHDLVSRCLGLRTLALRFDVRLLLDYDRRLTPEHKLRSLRRLEEDTQFRSLLELRRKFSVNIIWEASDMCAEDLGVTEDELLGPYNDWFRTEGRGFHFHFGKA